METSEEFKIVYKTYTLSFTELADKLNIKEYIDHVFLQDGLDQIGIVTKRRINNI